MSKVVCTRLLLCGSKIVTLFVVARPDWGLLSPLISNTYYSMEKLLPRLWRNSKEINHIILIILNHYTKTSIFYCIWCVNYKCVVRPRNCPPCRGPTVSSWWGNHSVRTTRSWYSRSCSKVGLRGHLSLCYSNGAVLHTIYPLYNLNGSK